MDVPHLTSLFGVVVILAGCWLLSHNRMAISTRTVLWGLGIQFFLGIALLRFPPGVALFEYVGNGVQWVLSFARVGAGFLFGNLASSQLEPVIGFQFALTIVSIIVFFSGLFTVLYHYGVVQKIVGCFAWILQRTMQTSAVESVSAAANVFLGQTEAPLLIKSYLPAVRPSELFAIMVGGFATIAGSTMGVYVAMGISPNLLMIASIMAAPGGLMLSKIIYPDVAHGQQTVSHTPRDTQNGIDALAKGALDGIQLAINVIAVLIAFKCCIALIDASMEIAANYAVDAGFTWVPHSLSELVGYAFLPFAWLMGIPNHELTHAAQLLGVKVTQTEFIAYEQLAALSKTQALSQRTYTLCAIALCGFANVLSIGIQIGGIGMLIPARRAEVAAFGIKAMLVGAITSILSACIAGVIL
jgi:concentrative nucleoside transporter, CNT family